jgi:glycerol-3-phosphate dehydrogenase
MNRSELLRQLAVPQSFDLAVIGGGATGLGVALEASRRGYKVVLLESHDFAKGTSSRSTKLVHGGVRYLAQGNVALVREALHERSVLLHDAPHLAQPIPFVMPSYRWWETAFYGIGLKLYDFLAGADGLGRTEFLSSASVLSRMPGLKAQGLQGGIQYWDGQFDDARFAINLARTAAQAGALLVNYCPVTEFKHAAGQLTALVCQDAETGQSFALQARCIVNATGVWVDQLRQMDALSEGLKVQPMVAPSQGVHLVVDRSFLPGEHALLVPKTADGRVLFAVPWLGKVILGTTDTPRSDMPREPAAFEEEVAFILGESARYLAKPPKRSDVRSVWVGLRPLVKPTQEEGVSTKGLSREHTVSVSRSGLVTVTGGKWTTYRAMADDVLSQCVSSNLLAAPTQAPSARAVFKGAGAQTGQPVSLMAPQGMHLYGTEQAEVAQLPGADHWLLPGLSEAMVRFAARFEFARTVEDVLARRSRALFLDAKASIGVAALVADLLMEEGCTKVELSNYLSLAQTYTLSPEVRDRPL